MLTLNTNMFMWSADAKEFFQEASTLRDNFSRIMRDGAFQLESQWTGDLVGVRLVTTERDHEGEVVLWRFRPSDNRFEVVIVND